LVKNAANYDVLFSYWLAVFKRVLFNGTSSSALYLLLPSATSMLPAGLIKEEETLTLFLYILAILNLN
jgi:hypothetical protein